MAAPVITSVVPATGTVAGLPVLAVHFTGDGAPYKLRISGGGSNREITGITSSPVLVGDSGTMNLSATAGLEDTFQISNVVGGVEVFSNVVSATYQFSLYTMEMRPGNIIRVTFNSALMSSPPLESSITTLARWGFFAITQYVTSEPSSVVKISPYVYDVGGSNLGPDATGKSSGLFANFYLEDGTYFFVKGVFRAGRYNKPTITVTPGYQQLTVAYTTSGSTPSEVSSTLKFLCAEYSLDAGATWFGKVAAGSPFNITGLNTGQAYSVKVRLRSYIQYGPLPGGTLSVDIYRGSTVSEASDTVVAAPADLPGAPTITSITTVPRNDGDFDIQIAYTPPVDDGGSPILDYWLSIVDNYSGSSPLNVNVGLSNPIVRENFNVAVYNAYNFIRAANFGSSYRLRMHARNAIGAGSYSEYAYFTPESAYYTATKLSANSVRVAFNPALMPAPPKSVSAVNIGDALNPGTWPLLQVGFATAFPASVTKIDSYTFDLLGLSATTYTFIRTTEPKLNGADALQLTNNTKFKVGISLISSQAPTTPTIVSVTASNNALTFEITPATNNTAGLPLYYEIVSTPAFNFYGYQQVTPNAQNKFTITGLPNGVPYQFKVRAYILQDPGTQLNVQTTPSGWSNTVVASAGAPIVPGAPTIESIAPGDEMLEVTVTPPSYDGGSPITSYEYNLNGGAFVSVGLETQFHITGLTNDTVYTVRVRAVNIAGAGPASAPRDGEPHPFEPLQRGFGITPWGRGDWGLGDVPATPPALGTAYAIGDRSVRVRLAFEPQHNAPTLLGDALNPKTWTLTALSTGRSVTPLLVTMVDVFTYDILTLELLDDALRMMRLRSTTLKSVDNYTVPTLEVDFRGSQLVSNVTDQTKTTAAGLALRDIANPQTPNSPVGGTLQITAGGDYASVTGEALVRKLVIRRLISKKGDFFHQPQYGAGLRIKDVVPTTDLRKLATEIERQVQLEPEVEAASVSLSYTAASSALVVQLSIRLRQTGQQVSVALSVPSGTMQL